MGQQIVVYTDHKNLTYNNFNTEHVMRWWLLIEEFGPTIEYIKGPKNIIDNALSRIDLVSSPSDLQDMADCYGLDKDDLPSNAFLITYQLINHEQNKDKTLLTTAKGAKHYMLKEFHGGNRSPQLLCYKNRIVIPKGLQNKSCSSITTLYATQESIKQKKLSLNISIKKIISTQNPQANAVVQRVHQMLRNLITSFELQENLYLNLDDPWLDSFAAALFAMCSTYHTTLHDAWPAHIWEGYDT